MRVALAGTSNERSRLRRWLTEAGVEVTGEFASMAAAQATSLEIDAIVVAVREGAPATEEPLTAREREVLELLADGLSNKAIAARLAISDQTVKFHVAAICAKLGAPNRTSAVRRGIRRGLVSI